MGSTPADRSVWDQVPLWLFVGGMILSYVTLYAFARAIGFDPLIAWIFPLLPDGFILYAAREASEAAAAGHKAARWWAWSMVILWTGVSAGLQALDAVHLGPAAMAGHMVPPVVMLCAWEMRLRRDTRHARHHHDPTPAQPAMPPAEVHAQLRAEVRDQIAATLRAEVATELRGMVAGELGAVRAELQRATATMPAPAVPAELPAVPANDHGADMPAGEQATTDQPASAPARDYPAGSRRRGRTGTATAVQARLTLVYQTNPDHTAWTERSLADAASCGKTAARTFLNHQRATAPAVPAELPAVPANDHGADMPAGEQATTDQPASAPARDYPAGSPDQGSTDHNERSADDASTTDQDW